jgi:hypothetical protein
MRHKKRYTKDGWRIVATTEFDQHPSWSVLQFPEDATVDLLDSFFGDGGPNEMNFLLFSTSGIHGSATTLEDCEEELKKPLSEREIRDDDDSGEPWPVTVTVLLVQPRIIGLRYGNLTIRNLDDIERLKRYRAASHAVIAKIGMP